MGIEGWKKAKNSRVRENMEKTSQKRREIRKRINRSVEVVFCLGAL